MALTIRTGLLATATAELGALSALPAAAQTTLTLSSWVPPAHTLTTGQIEWCEMLAQKAAGSIALLLSPWV